MPEEPPVSLGKAIDHLGLQRVGGEQRTSVGAVIVRIDRIVIEVVCLQQDQYKFCERQQPIEDKSDSSQLQGGGSHHPFTSLHLRSEGMGEA